MYVNKKIIFFFVFIGIGIGLLIGSILNLVNPNIVVKEYSDEEIKALAKDLGMIDLKEYIENSEKLKEDEDEKKEDSSENAEGKKQFTEDKEEKEETILFEIKKGQTSEVIANNLFEVGIIDSKEEFHKLVVEKGVEKKFKYGIFKIDKSLNYEEIIDILTK